MSNKGTGKQIPRELGSYFLEDVFLSRHGGCDTIFIFPMNPVQISFLFLIEIKDFMLKIWGRANSVNVQKAVWATAEIGVAFERVDAGMALGKNNEDWYLELNPNGKIPLLQHEGFSLWESNVIVRYLCQTFSMGKLCREEVELRFLAEQWMDWTVSELGPAMHPVFWGLVRTPPEERNQQAIESGIKACIMLFTMLDKHLQHSGFVCGSDFTMGDIPAGAMAYRWFNMEIDRPVLEALQEWYEKLLERPAYREHVVMPLT